MGGADSDLHSEIAVADIPKIYWEVCLVQTEKNTLRTAQTLLSRLTNCKSNADHHPSHLFLQ